METQFNYMAELYVYSLFQAQGSTAAVWQLVNATYQGELYRKALRPCSDREFLKSRARAEHCLARAKGRTFWGIKKRTLKKQARAFRRASLRA